MSGLLALLDDVAAIARMAATTVDDVVGQAARAGSKAAGAAIDDAAVSPRYVRGFAPARELPIVGKIALGSIRNKMLILLPAGLLLSEVAPWSIPPLLMLGGAYLCFEGAEKVWHAVMPGAQAHADAPREAPGSPQHLEEAKVRGAVKTDFILSAEIMTIALAAIEVEGVLLRAAVLAVVAVLITAAVYGSVALIVKADDAGLWLSRNGRASATRAAGRAVVRGMPAFLRGLTLVGTAAMLWVGGSIIVHALAGVGWAGPEHAIAAAAEAFAQAATEAARPAVIWIAEAAMGGLLGLALGCAMVPLVQQVLVPLGARVTGRGAGHR